MSSQVPVIDLAPRFSGDGEARAAVAADVDGALRSAGFFLISGHGVADQLRAQVRAQACLLMRGRIQGTSGPNSRISAALPRSRPDGHRWEPCWEPHG